MAGKYLEKIYWFESNFNEIRLSYSVNSDLSKLINELDLDIRISEDRHSIDISYLDHYYVKLLCNLLNTFNYECSDSNKLKYLVDESNKEVTFL